MNRDEFEKVPENVESGNLSWEQAIRKMVVFVLQNKALFGLFKYDDDFISELIIEFLDRGEEVMKQYKRENGAFFSYTYCFIKNTCTTLVKRKSIKHIIDYHNINESIITYENKVELYEKIEYSDFERPKVPYKYTPISYKDFQIACKTDTYHIKKVINSKESCFSAKIQEKLKNYSPRMIHNMLLVLALSSSFYITEEQIKNIATLFNIDNEKFHQIIQRINLETQDRQDHKAQIEMRRNKAYFQHKKLQNQIEFSKTSENNNPYLITDLNKQYKRNTNNWHTLNHQLEEGKIMIRPTTKLIAKVLGLSTRQVTYYRSTARKLGIYISKV